MASGFTWTQPPEKVWPAGAATYVAAVRRGIHAVCQRWTPEIETWMKTNAVWKDRTANARQGLYSAVDPPTAEEVMTTISVVLYHSVYYGYYLEGWNPKTNVPMTRKNHHHWRIIQPAIDHFAPKIMADLRKLLS